MLSGRGSPPTFFLMTIGKLFIVSAPSGAGKTSLLKKTLHALDRFHIAVSHTTRPPRAGEEDGRDYHFVSRDKFGRMIERGGFLEHAEVFGHRYGTARAEVGGRLSRGENVVLEIDWQGAQQVRRGAPGAFSIFILPPSMDALQKRLEKRGQDSPETVARRLGAAREEVAHHDEFDARIVNENFDRTCGELQRLLSGGAADPAEEALARRTLRTLLEV